MKGLLTVIAELYHRFCMCVCTLICLYLFIVAVLVLVFLHDLSVLFLILLASQMSLVFDLILLIFVSNGYSTRS